MIELHHGWKQALGFVGQLGRKNYVLLFQVGTVIHISIEMPFVRALRPLHPESKDSVG
jgi:hypothetical protein